MHLTDDENTASFYPNAMASVWIFLTWLAMVRQILQGISTLGWKSTWDSLLSNGTANFPNGSYQTGIVYGDYYYIKVPLLFGVHTLPCLYMQQRPLDDCAELTYPPHV